jgi:DhnA family fructose-bisphosphate aldolase class Ia
VTTVGKTTHIRRLQHPISGRILTIALDHAPSYGVLAGLENIRQVIDEVATGQPEAIMLMKGPAERCFEPYAGSRWS